MTLSLMEKSFHTAVVAVRNDFSMNFRLRRKFNVIEWTIEEFGIIHGKGDIAPTMKLTPFLLFDGNCAEAMAFYQKCLGGELTLTKLGDTPMKDQFPPEQHHKIVNAYLKSGALEFSATDWLHPTQLPKQGNTIGLYVINGKYNELKAIFDPLSEGADQETFVELQNMPFGSYGHLIDKYSVPWFFVGEKQE